MGGWQVWSGGGGGGNAISGSFDSIAFNAKHVFHSASFSSAEARLCDSRFN